MTQLTWLVTGCSSGFGEAFVHEIPARGDQIIATGRKASGRLIHLKDKGPAILDIDITATQADLDAKVQDALGIYGGIDVLVNNAGYFELGLIEEIRYVVILSFKNGIINLEGRKLGFQQWATRLANDLLIVTKDGYL